MLFTSRLCSTIAGGPLLVTYFFSWVTKSTLQKWELAGQTGHFENEIGFFQEFLMKKDFLCAYYLGNDWSSWIILTAT